MEVPQLGVIRFSSLLEVQLLEPPRSLTCRQAINSFNFQHPRAAPGFIERCSFNDLGAKVVVSVLAFHLRLIQVKSLRSVTDDFKFSHARAMLRAAAQRQ